MKAPVWNMWEINLVHVHRSLLFLSYSEKTSIWKANYIEEYWKTQFDKYDNTESVLRHLGTLFKLTLKMYFGCIFLQWNLSCDYIFTDMVKGLKTHVYTDFWLFIIIWVACISVALYNHERYVANCL